MVVSSPLLTSTPKSSKLQLPTSAKKEIRISKPIEINETLNLSLKEIKDTILINSHKNGTKMKYPFTSMMWNIRTMNDKKLRKLSEIVSFLSRNEVREDKTQKKDRRLIIDVIAIVEFGKKCSKFNTFNLNGYDFYSILRNDRKGGGIALFVNNKININIKFSQITSDYEMIHAELFKEETHLINLLVTYRPPNGDKENFINKLDSILFENDEMILMGDININSIQSASTEPLTENYLDMLTSHNYSIRNKAITRFNHLTNRHSIIDHIITRKSNSELFTLTSDEATIKSFSDHNIIFIVQPGNSNLIKSNKKLTIDKTNKAKVIKDLRNNFTSIPINIHPEQYCDSIVNTVQEVIKANTKTFTLKTNESMDHIPPWANTDYIKMCNTIYNLNHKIEKLKKEGKPTSKLENKLNDTTNRKESFELERILWYYNDRALLNDKEMFKVLNELSGICETRKQITLEIEGAKVSNEGTVANIFQDYFMSIVGEKCTQNVDCTFMEINPNTTNKFSFNNVTESKVRMIMSALNIGKATGLDKISPFVWNNLHDIGAENIAILFNSMIDKCKYPERLKETLIHPIHKAGSKMCVSNYRPISVTNSLNKVIEREIYDQLDEYLREHDLMDKYQYGFVKQKGCTDVIAKVISLISSTIDNRKSSVLISLDLSKAFDSIEHDVLIFKMQKLGIGQKAIQLTKSYLSSRYQCVKVGNSFSTSGLIKRGIPQGTILGPLFFKIYIADMQYMVTNSEVFKFADDTVLLLEINDINEASEKIKEDLSSISNYYERNCLKLNLNKSQAVIFGNSNPEMIKQALNENGITLTDEIKYLGVQIDSDLRFETFASSIRSKLNQAIGAMSVLRKKLLTGSLLKFYYAHYQSHLMYATFLLLRVSTKDLNQLQIQQNKMLKMIFNLPFSTPTDELFTNHAKNILPIMGLIFYVVCSMVHKSLHTSDESLFKVEKLQSSRVNLLKINKCNLLTKRNDIETIGPSLFNSLPREIRDIESPSIFKIRLKMFLLSINQSTASRQQISNRNQII